MLTNTMAPLQRQQSCRAINYSPRKAGSKYSQWPEVVGRNQAGLGPGLGSNSQVPHGGREPGPASYPWLPHPHPTDLCLDGRCLLLRGPMCLTSTTRGLLGLQGGLWSALFHFQKQYQYRLDHECGGGGGQVHSVNMNCTSCGVFLLLHALGWLNTGRIKNYPHTDEKIETQGK